LTPHQTGTTPFDIALDRHRIMRNAFTEVSGWSTRASTVRGRAPLPPAARDA
jgi:hypothetical protein